MTSYVAKKLARHFMNEKAANSYGADDAMFERVAAVDNYGNPTGKSKKVKRPIPEGLTAQEAKVLKKVTRRAYHLDNAMTFCGIRIGWGAIVGLIPGLGDVFDTLMALMVLRTAEKAGIPASLRAKMQFNIMIDFVIGIIPFIGDVADALFRANTRNAILLYEHLEERGRKRIQNGEVDEANPGVVTKQPQRGQTLKPPQQVVAKNGGGKENTAQASKGSGFGGFFSSKQGQQGSTRPGETQSQVPVNSGDRLGQQTSGVVEHT